MEIKFITHTLRMIKFEHSIFALPFALSSLFVATNGYPVRANGRSPLLFLLIIAAMITARNAAMTFNRIVDRHVDAKNPRTAQREIPKGKVSMRFALFFCIINALLFVCISFFFNPLTALLSPLALMIILGYSYTKRFTHYSQFFLGLALGSAPIATWIAATNSISLFSVLLGLAVLFWVAGFDIIYATQDYDFDKQVRLKSLVVKLGIGHSLVLSRFVHCVSFVLLVLCGLEHALHWPYFLGCAIVGVLLFYEHTLVKKDDLSRVNAAFFTINGYVGVLYMVFVLIETLIN